MIRELRCMIVNEIETKRIRRIYFKTFYNIIIILLKILLNYIIIIQSPSDKAKSRVLENRIIRKMYRTIKDNEIGECRIRYNFEIFEACDHLTLSKPWNCIVWGGRGGGLARMGEDHTEFRVATSWLGGRDHWEAKRREEWFGDGSWSVRWRGLIAAIMDSRARIMVIEWMLFIILQLNKNCIFCETVYFLKIIYSYSIFWKFS